MWLKLCLLLIYIIVLFVLARLVEALTWYETGSLSRRLLDPMALSVAKLKALLEQRGVSYDTVVEKAELTKLVEGSGQVHEDDVELLQSTEDIPASANTNFTSGAHFYEQVEDAKDSVWLVQVIAQHYSHNHIHTLPLPEMTWKSLRKKVTKFGVHTGVLDCNLDPWWCDRRGWHSSHLLLALPQVYKQKANVATHVYQGPLRQNMVSHWIRQKLHEKIETIQDFRTFKDEWMTFRKTWRDAEVRAVLFTDQESIPVFFSALSVKFPGRVKFGMVHDLGRNQSLKDWTQAVLPGENHSLPLYLLLTNEGTYVYGKNRGDCLTFSSMETLLKFLHPCLNDIFIFSFLMANMVSVLEFFIVQGGLGRRFKRCLWCIVKYNTAAMMLWLPLIALFQFPYLDNLPLVGLRTSRLLATSGLGEAMRRDVFFFSQHLILLAASFLSACMVFGLLAYKATGGRYEEDNEPWFNFAQMRTLTHLRSNEFFEPMFMRGYSGGMEIFGSRLYLPTMSLQPVVSPHYIHLLPTWQYYSKAKLSHDCHSKMPCPSKESGNENDCGSGSLERKAEIGHDSAGSAVPSLAQESAYSHVCPGTASASDLMDRNYQCECGQNPICLSAPRSSVQSSTVSDPPASEESLPCEGLDDAISPGDTSWCSKCQQCPEMKSARSANPQEQESGGVEERNSLDCLHESQSSSAMFPEGYLACSSCVICLEEFSEGVVLCGLPCSHVFHHSCILTWLKRDHHFCPVCRWPSFKPRPQLVHDHAE